MAVPMQYQNSTKSNLAQQRIASNSFWNQVSKTIVQKEKDASMGPRRSAKDQTSNAAQSTWQNHQELSDNMQDPKRD